MFFVFFSNINQFAKDTFKICHKIKKRLHKTGVSSSGKSYVLRSIRNGLTNCGTMRCQVPDNFTFGLYLDKTLIYTDKMWFTPQNIEEAKCNFRRYANVKHQMEQLLKRTPPLSTSNCEPWKVILHEKDVILNHIHHYETNRAMPQLKEWGQIKLNPLMWLSIWRKHGQTQHEYISHTTRRKKQQDDNHMMPEKEYKQ